MAGDELGAALISGRLLRAIMHLCFLMARRYAPYAKWFGSAFAQLPIADELLPVLRAVQLARLHQERQLALCAACECLNRQHNTLGLTAVIEPALLPFHDRGFQVSAAWRYSEGLLAAIKDSEMKALLANQRGVLPSAASISSAIIRTCAKRYTCVKESRSFT